MTSTTTYELIESTKFLIIEANKEISDLRKELKNNPDNEFIKAAIELIQEINRDQRALYKELLLASK